jgi:hypothetical protein
MPDHLVELLVTDIAVVSAFREQQARRVPQGEPVISIEHSSPLSSPPLAEIGFAKAGAHAFRRYRTTFLRNYTNAPESIVNFWLGWGSEGMSGHYDKVRFDVEFRKEVAERVGVGFDVPVTLVPIEPKIEVAAEIVNA